MNRIAVESATGSVCYAAIQTETGFLFHLCSDFNGFNPKEFDRPVTAPGRKDIVVENRQILSRELRQLYPFEGKFNQKWALALHLTGGRTLNFRISGKHGLPELRRFFGLHDDEICVPERRLDYGKTIRRSEAKMGRYHLLFAGCFMLHGLVLIGAAFLPYWLWLLLGLTALLAPAALALGFPQWFTLTKASAESRYYYGKKLLPVWLAMMFFPCFLLLRLPEYVTYSSIFQLVLTGLIPMLLLSAGVWLRSPERKAAPKTLALMLAIWTAFGCSAGPAVNCADYYLRGPIRTEYRRITELEHTSVGSGTDRYYATAGSAGGDLTFVITEYDYETLREGETVAIDFYSGVLGVSYFDMYLP